MPEPPPAGGRYRLKSRATGFFLKGQGHHELALTVVADPNPVPGTIWVLEDVDFGFRLRHLPEGAALDSNLERQVYIIPANGGSFQKWELLDGDDEGFWSLKNVATGLALDGNLDRDIYTMRRNDGAFQRWQFQTAE